MASRRPRPWGWRNVVTPEDQDLAQTLHFLAFFQTFQSLTHDEVDPCLAVDAIGELPHHVAVIQVHLIADWAKVFRGKPTSSIGELIKACQQRFLHKLTEMFPPNLAAPTGLEHLHEAFGVTRRPITLQNATELFHFVLFQCAAAIIIDLVEEVINGLDGISGSC